ncbi:hypothetical protein [Roseateles chitinivorans]|uniref:hypothetical protein n=1 Tax=Roseateles chitinivorans TaxID=2917965 RepID=UPI003D67DFC0
MKRQILCVKCKALLVTVSDAGQEFKHANQLKVGPIKDDGSRTTDLICTKCGALTPFDIETPPELH